MIDYLNDLREGCLSAYTGIIQGLRNAALAGNEPTAGNNAAALAELQLVTAQLPFIMQFLETIARDTNKSDSIVGSAIGLIGDLVTSYGSVMVQFVERDAFEKLLAEGKRSKVMKTKTLATWAMKEIRKLKHNWTTKSDNNKNLELHSFVVCVRWECVCVVSDNKKKHFLFSSTSLLSCSTDISFFSWDLGNSCTIEYVIFDLRFCKLCRWSFFSFFLSSPSYQSFESPSDRRNYFNSILLLLSSLSFSFSLSLCAVGAVKCARVCVCMSVWVTQPVIRSLSAVYLSSSNKNLYELTQFFNALDSSRSCSFQCTSLWQEVAVRVNHWHFRGAPMMSNSGYCLLAMWYTESNDEDVEQKTILFRLSVNTRRWQANSRIDPWWLVGLFYPLILHVS